MKPINKRYLWVAVAFALIIVAYVIFSDEDEQSNCCKPIYSP